MIKDKRYITIRNLIQSGHINLFREIFDTLPKSVLYKDLGMNNERFTSLMQSVELFILRDLFRIADLLEIEKDKILEIVYNQYKADNKKNQKIRKTSRGK